MRKILILLTICASSTFAIAQDQTIKKLKSDAERSIAKDAADTTSKVWKKGGSYGLNISQGSLSNWAAGGDDFSLAVNSVLNLYAFYKNGKHSWDNTLDFNLGYVNTTSLGSRKNDDRLDILSKYGYAIAPKWNLSGLFNFRSQLFDGYTYADTTRTFASTLLSPAYILVSPGIDFKPVEGLSIFVSPATSRWTIVLDDTLSKRGDYGVDPGKHSRNEIGAFASINYIKDFGKVLSYKGRLDLFSNYKGKAKNVDVYFTNVLNVKLTRILSLTYSLDMIYDDDVRLFGPTKEGARTQLKSVIGAGLLLKF
ncbi:MAG: hypothetical protein DI535_02670 [Citrobacter freundii]|nr:MAG: hypothetical protein DI535_02670 [Citrobacter freundii]